MKDMSDVMMGALSDDSMKNVEKQELEMMPPKSLSEMSDNKVNNLKMKLRLDLALNNLRIEA